MSEPVPMEMSNVETGAAWRPVEKVLFRFACGYFLLYWLPSPFNNIPGTGWLFGPFQTFWDALAPWVGKHVFGVGMVLYPTGSSDTPFKFVRFFCVVVLALLVTLVWTLLDRRRADYRRLHEWLRVYVRFVLGIVMLSYGAIKVIKAQFVGPALDRLLQPIGDASPMGLLWTFMAASTSYNVFAGACEMAGGLLLLASRRTTLLGALVSTAAMTQVAMLNLSYDVPVKLLSLQLLALALFLALPDMKRLFTFLVLNQAVAPAPPRPLLSRPWAHRGAIILRALVLVVVPAWLLYGAHQTRKEYGDRAPRSPLYGVWNVVELELDGVARPPLALDDQRLRRFVFDKPYTLSVQRMDASRQRFDLALDEQAQTLALKEYYDSEELYAALTYQRWGSEELLVGGTFGGQQICARLERQDPQDFLLLNRGFHWVSEYPFNR